MNRESNEMQAEVVGATKKLLRQRLNEARQVLRRDLMARFQDPTLDFENKRLISDDGKIALQWRLRLYPDQPISYENQQTSRGTVVVVSAKALKHMRLTQEMNDRLDEVKR